MSAKGNGHVSPAGERGRFENRRYEGFDSYALLVCGCSGIWNNLRRPVTMLSSIV